MRFIFFGLAIIIIVTSIAFRTKEKYPNGLLTLSYGIVTEDDLAYDASKRQISPYDPYTGGASLYWQCFPLSEVKAKYDSWRGLDGMGPWNKIYTMCSAEIRVQHDGELQVYTGRR